MISDQGRLSIDQISAIINNAEKSFRQEDCPTCECYLGYIAQLELDGDQEVQEYLAKYKPAREVIHSCLGCDPCPPGILYADYLKNKPIIGLDE